MDDKKKPVELPPHVPYEEISFSSSGNYCVCYVDLINSTVSVSRNYDSVKIRKYYSLFLNAMAAIARNFGAKIVKNAGDSIIFYFPDSLDSTSKDSWNDILECLVALIDARTIINNQAYNEGLPSISYRISADYGKVEVAKSLSSKSDDLFGPTMNMCAKINELAEPNTIVVGGDFYQVIRYLHLDGNYYNFIESALCTADSKFSYSVYRLKVNKINPLDPFKRTSKFLALAKSTSSQDQTKRSKKNIMLIDDEFETLTTFKWFLEGKDYSVDTFANGEKALNHFLAVGPSYYGLIITDVRMSPMNGFELYNHIRELCPAIKVLFVSALDAIEELASLVPGIQKSQILRKPINKENFVQAVEKNLDTHAN